MRDVLKLLGDGAQILLGMIATILYLLFWVVLFLLL